MGALEQVMQMKQQNPSISDQEIISALRKQNPKISPKEINDALHHATIVSAVQGENQENDLQAPYPGGEQYLGAQAQQDQAYQPQGYAQQQGQEQDYGNYPEQGQNQGYDQSQVYTPQPQEYYPQQGYQQGYAQQPQGYGDYYSQQTNTDTIVDIAEQVFDEKSSELSKRVDSIEEFKTLAQSRIDQLNERLKRIEMVIDRLQAAILEKIGSYGTSLDSIKKEMSMMQDTFSRTLPELNQKKPARIQEEKESDEDHEKSVKEERVPKRKK